MFAVILRIVSRTRHDFIKKTLLTGPKSEKKEKQPKDCWVFPVGTDRWREAHCPPPPHFVSIIILCEVHGLYLAVSEKYGSMA